MKFLYPSGAKPLDGYTIKRGVGRGGFGEVYFATSDAGKEVALKLIRRNLDVELRGVRHCLNLKHPNLIGLYDIRTDDLDDQWVVMEYVSGQSLEDVIDAHPGGMPVEQALWWFRSIAAGVGYLHDHGIVHRDLKPGNIFLDHDASVPGQPGTVKIGDYGLSKFISCSRRSGQTESVGTVHYMAPEIANGRYGREIDTYALGVILYEMLTGHVPFEGESVGEVLMKHLTAEPDLAAVPEAFREIIRRSLAKDPELRLSSVGDILAMLPGHAQAAPAAAAAQADPALQHSGEFERFPGYDYDERLHRSSQYAAHKSAAPRPVVQEPMYAAIGGSLGRLRQQWMASDAPAPLKVLVLVLLVLALLPTMGIWMPILLGLAVFYAIYYVAWTLILKPGAVAHAQRAGVAASLAPAAKQPPRPAARNNRGRPKPWREVVHRQLAAKTRRDVFTELLGSMLTSGVLCVVVTAVLSMLIVQDSSANAWQATHLWMAIVTTLGCWGVLATTKLTEGRVEDQAPMRSILLGAGALIGLIAFGLTQGLALELPISRDMGPPPNDALVTHAFDIDDPLREGWSAGAVAPVAVVSMVYFALLFALPRWWRVAEFTRDKRLSLWSVVGLLIWAWLLHIVWWYPQPLGMAVVGVVAVVTQLSSPWFPPSKRAELARQRAAI